MKIGDMDLLQPIIGKLKKTLVPIYKLLLIILPVGTLKHLATKGSTVAQIILARRYYHGRCVAGNKKLALRWWTKAASQGSYEAKKELGHLYFSGEKFKKDWRLASTYLLEAYHQGEKDCASVLGSIYEGNKHFRRDVPEMYKWHKIAAESGCLESQIALAGIYASEKEYINPKKMMFWLRKAANQDDIETMLLLAQGYLDKQQYDLNQAIKWLKIAAKKNHHHALFLLGYIYSSDKYKVVDYNYAFLKYYYALKAGSEVAPGRLGYMYQYGLGVDKDIEQAKSLYSMGALYNDPYAQFYYAELYLDEKYGMMDLLHAFKWSYWANKNNHPGAEKQFKAISDKLTESQIKRGLRAAQQCKVKPVKSFGFQIGYRLGDTGKIYR
ncbi:tetratricopeptide repeat protein [Vibrio sp. T11.5]|uniref:tetratricopeptide repeat protein n=1 Tax=Vibrio sp. T11.5 TaxID=2998836 RepID=UPI0022CD5196|nr:SEL1-like repeat protein [Vibrio sp. T11.5]MDA0118770.1 SEL1-like repeat protein [Vibrio sp. T11.5]